MTERVHPDPLSHRPIDTLHDVVPVPFAAHAPSTEPLALLGTLLGEATAVYGVAADARVVRHLASCRVIGACIQLDPSVRPTPPTPIRGDTSFLLAGGGHDRLAIPRQPASLAEAINEQAASLSPTEAMRHILDQLEGYTHYLATGERLTDWPHAALYGELLTPKGIADMQHMAAIVRHAIEPLRKYDAGSSGDFAYRYHKWLIDTCDLLFSRKLIGIAAPLINTATEGEGPFILHRLQQAMATVREEQGAQTYRRLYGRAYHALIEPWRSIFVRHNPRLPAELVPGSQRELIQWEGSSTLIERSAIQLRQKVRLVGGQSTELPYTEYHERTFGDYDTPAEIESSALQQRVAYTHLDPEAQRAIAKAVRVHARGVRPPSTPAYYKRLALKKQPGQDATLHTVRFRPGVQRNISMYPDDGGRKHHPAHHMLEDQVTAAEAVCDGYLVVPYRGGNPMQATFGDTDPNFFGPGAEAANAFWVAGGPRIVEDASEHPDRMRASFKPGKRDTPRWVIMPIQYFRIDAPDTRPITGQ